MHFCGCDYVLCIVDGWTLVSGDTQRWKTDDWDGWLVGVLLEHHYAVCCGPRSYAVV